MTKKFLLICTAIFFISGIIWANPEKKTLRVGGFDREYLVYTPQNIHKEKADGIIVCLHGFGRTMNDFFEGYNISYVADALNLIIAAPQALPEKDPKVILQASILSAIADGQLSLNSVWGCGLSVKATTILGTLLEEELNKDVNDVDFINKIIDDVLQDFSLPPENIFLLGTSMGGYMAYQFALMSGDRLSGLVSIAGSMGLSIKVPDYSTKVPICDFHSITDEVVPYNGSMSFTSELLPLPVTVNLAKGKPAVIKYWAETNLAGTPETEPVENYPSTNGITVEKITYPDPNNEVIHYKLNGSSHSYFFKKENGDCMDHAEEIAKFIFKHISGGDSKIQNIAVNKVFFHPNPVEDNIYFNTMNGIVSIFDISGKKIFEQSFLSGQSDISFLKSGIYIIRVQSGNTVQVGRMIKR